MQPRYFGSLLMVIGLSGCGANAETAQAGTSGAAGNAPSASESSFSDGGQPTGDCFGPLPGLPRTRAVVKEVAVEAVVADGVCVEAPLVDLWDPYAPECAVVVQSQTGCDCNAPGRLPLEDHFALGQCGGAPELCNTCACVIAPMLGTDMMSCLTESETTNINGYCYADAQVRTESIFVAVDCPHFRKLRLIGGAAITSDDRVVLLCREPIVCN